MAIALPFILFAGGMGLTFNGLAPQIADLEVADSDEQGEEDADMNNEDSSELSTVTETASPLVANKKKEEKKGTLVICGPSGVGKGTIVRMLLDEFGERKVGFSVSHTTRSPRLGEIDGKDYHFATKADMEQMIRENKFIEYAHVHGNIYGTAKASVLAVTTLDKVCILEIDTQGAESVAKSDIDALFVFILPPSIEELEKRLRRRGTEDEATIQRRLEAAHKELEEVCLPFWDAKIINDEKMKTYSDVRTLLVDKCM